MLYAVLYNPGHNRVYFETSLKLSVSEFSIVSKALSVPCEQAEIKNILGINYLTFHTAGELSSSDIKIISALSFAYAVFKAEEINGELYLNPLDMARGDFVDESMSTILKYTGKTNELFTRMMINLAVYSQNERDGIKLLDPVAGKGTTLYEGLIKGYDVYGIEIGDKVVNEAYHFIKKFLETAKYKFDTSSLRISGPNKSFTALRHSFKTARTKEDFKAGKTKTVELIAGNSMYANKYYKKSFFDIAVGDLPYGVQHGNVTGENQSSLTRNPSELLSACLPSWHEVLKPGGALVLAWNSHVLPRRKMTLLLEERGFTVMNDEEYLRFEHRVDQSILRDIVVALKI